MRRGQMKGNEYEYTASEARHNPATLAQIKSIKDSGFELDPSAVISADDLNNFLKLEAQPPRRHMQCSSNMGITLYQGDAFAAYVCGFNQTL